MILDHDNNRVARRSEIMPLIHAMHLADVSMEFEAALKAMAGYSVPPSQANGLRNHLNRIANQIENLLSTLPAASDEATTRSTTPRLNS